MKVTIASLKAACFAFALISFSSQLNAQITAGLSADDSGLSLKNSANVALSNGFVLQIGYFDGASVVSGSLLNPFSGNFTVIAGAGSANTRYAPGGAQPVEIGSFSANFPAPGGFNFTINFLQGDPTTASSSFPSTGAPLAVRFFDSASTGAGFFNTVSNAAWTWAGFGSPPPGSVNIALGDDNLAWQDNANPFKTTIAVPEPAAWLLALIGCSLVALTRPLLSRK
jgi:hypothetical protein